MKGTWRNDPVVWWEYLEMLGRLKLEWEYFPSRILILKSCVKPDPKAVSAVDEVTIAKDNKPYVCFSRGAPDLGPFRE